MKRERRLIDFHSHILPGADHGSSGISESLNQMRMIQKYDVDTLVATPHFYPNRHRIDSFLEKTDRSVQQLCEAQLPFVSRLCVGAEVLYCERIDQMEGLEKLCIRGTDVLLLELPLEKWGEEIVNTVELLLERYTVVLAHIDRYLYQPKRIQTLLEMGALAQINAESLFSFLTRQKLKPFLSTPSLVAVASDLHNVDEATYSKFATVDRHLGALTDRITERSETLLRSAENFLN